jgi:hypothetical protein
MSAAHDMPDLLERLLTDDTFRDDFSAGRVALPAAFASVDRLQLARTAAQLARDLVQRQFRGSGGLLARFPKTLAGVTPAEREAIFSRFVASPAYRAYREWPREGIGQCLEEAFYRFAEAIELGDPVAREAEFLAAAVRAVLLSPDPGFAPPPELVQHAGGVTFALARRGPAPLLFAATPKGLVQGPLTPFLADLLTSFSPRSSSPAEVARRHAVSPVVLSASLARLRQLGVLEPSEHAPRLA